MRRRPVQPLLVSEDRISLPAKAQIAPRKKARGLPTAWVLVLVCAGLAGATLYWFIDRGGFYDAHSVETAKPLSAPKPTRLSQPHDVLVLSTPPGARIMIDDRVVGQTPHRIRIPVDVEGLGIMLFLDDYQRQAIRLTRENGEERLAELDRVDEATEKESSPSNSSSSSNEELFELELDD